MNEQRYLIEILLRARDQASQLFQKVADQLNKVEKAQDNVSDSTRRANAVVEQQRGALEQLHQARIREKKGLDDSAAALRGQSSAARQNADTLRSQAAQVRASADALRAQRDATVKAQQASLAEASSLRDLARARADQVGAIDKTAQQLTRQAEAARREADQNRRLASSYDQSIRAVDRRANALERDALTSDRSARAADRMATSHERSSSTVARSISTITRQLAGLDSRTRTTEAATSRFGRTLQRLGIQADSTKSNLRGLNAEFQGFQLAVVIKYAQSLLSALIALGGQLVAVAAAAGQAAAGLGAAFGAAAAQAIPVVGVLAAAFGRLTAVLKAVKLQNQQQLAVTHNTATEARRQTAAADQIRNAQQQVADAHRNVARAVQNLAQVQSDSAREQIRAQNDVVRAQQDAARNLTSAQQSVTQARKDAIRTVEDLVAAERDAQVQLLQAQAQLRGSVQSGDVLGTLAAFDARAAARRGVTRARQDAAPVRARGVEGVPAVQQAEQQLSDTRVQGRQQVSDAEQRLADVRRTSSRAIASAEQQVSDAQRQSRRSEQDLARTRVQATQNIAQETAATDKLTNSIKLLSPAERQLYRRILALQETYKRAVRPITDIITRAFTGVVDRVNTLLQDPKLMRGFRNIAVQISRSIRSGLGEVTGPRSVGLFEQLQREAARNIPTVTRIIKNLFRTVRELIHDALPAFRELLRFVDGYAGSLRKAVETHPKQITDFFVAGVKSAESFFRLGLSVIRLLLSIAGHGGAAHEGRRTIDDLTKTVDGLTEKANKNAGKIRKFFRQTHDAAFEVLGVLGSIAKAAIGAFNTGSVKTMADFLKQVIIPAVSTVVQIMGLLVNAFHTFATLPGVSKVLEVLAAFLLSAKGLTIIHHAVSSITKIIPDFLRGFGLMKVAEEGAAAELTFFEAMTPGGWILLAIAALVAAIILLDKKFHFLGPTFKWLKNAAKNTFDWLKGAGASVVKWAEDVWNKGLLKWIRAPFVAVFNFLKDAGVFKWIVNAAKNVVRFFSGGGTGARGELWSAIGEVIAAPFNLAKGSIKLILRLIVGLVKTFLDILAGRFGDARTEMKSMFDDIISTLAGAVTSLLGIVSKLFGVLGKIPGPLGAPFRAAAQGIDNARHSIDKWRESLRNHKKAQDNSTQSINDSIPQVVRLHDRYHDAKVQLDKLTPGTNDYKDAVKRANRAHQDYNDALHTAARRADGAVQPTKKLRDNVQNLGNTTADTAKVVADNLNSVLKQVGAKTIDYTIARAPGHVRGIGTTFIPGGVDITKQGATGGLLVRHFFSGGVPNPGSSYRDDHMLLSPSGMPVAALSGTEGIVNTPQMGIIDDALAFSRAMGAMPWGSLNELWGSGMRHYAGGGGLHWDGHPPLSGGIANAVRKIEAKFPLVVTATTDGRHAPGSYHYKREAADLSGASNVMDAAASWIKSSGMYRSLAEGIHNPNLAVQQGHIFTGAGPFGGVWANHLNHIHVAVTGALGRLSAGIARLLAPRITGPAGPLLNIARGGARRMTRAANRYIERAIARMGGADTADYASVRGMGGSAAANRSLGRRMMLAFGFGAGQWPFLDRLWNKESGWDANARNRTSGAAGIVQDITGNMHGGARGQIAWGLNYIKNRYGSPSRAWAHEQAFNWYQRGGRLPRFRSDATLKGVARPTRVGTAAPLAASLTRALNPINTLMDGVFSALEAVARGPLRRSQHLAHRITAAFDKLTGPDGLLDLMAAAVDAIATRATAALQRRQFRVGRGGPRRIYQSPADAAQAQLQTLQSTRTGLIDEQTAIQSNLTDAQRALAIAQRRHNARAAAVARAAIDGLRQRQAKVAQDLAQNAQDQVEAQESFQQALLDSVTAAADQQNNAIDRWSRVAKALGQTIDPNVVLRAQIANMRRQIDGLQNVLARAMRTGNLDLARTVRDQINDLNTQIAEAVAQQFQNAIDAVNNEAARQITRLDRATRRAQIGGQTDFAALQGILTQRQDVMATQRAGLQALIDRAFASGNVDQFDNLADQIDELDTAMAENTQAIKDNSDAAFNLTTQMVNDRASFATGIFSSAQGFFQALTQATGLDTSAQQLAALQATNATLADQQSGLRDQIAKLLDFTPDWQQWLRNLSGADLVGYLSSLVASPTFSAYLDTLDPTQQQSFRDLISSLIGNATAVEQNTQAITDLTGATTQSFASSFWTAFRTAVFTGEGQLLPQYAMTIPSADVGARVMQSGALMVHAGETVRPAAVNRDWRGGGGDTYNLSVTTPTEVLDPVDVNRQLAFLRRTSGRR